VEPLLVNVEVKGQTVVLVKTVVKSVTVLGPVEVVLMFWEEVEVVGYEGALDVVELTGETGVETAEVVGYGGGVGNDEVVFRVAEDTLEVVG
jgi:hypothetical protein